MDEEGAFRGLVEALRRHREEEGVTQVTLAEEAKVSRSTIRRMESGDATPDYKTVGRVIEALGWSAHELADALDRENDRPRRRMGQEPDPAEVKAMARRMPWAPVDLLRDLVAARQAVDAGLMEYRRLEAKLEEVRFEEADRVTKP